MMGGSVPYRMDFFHPQIILPGFSVEKQERIFNARVGVVGMGGLGTIASQYLVYSGVKKLKIIDGDRIEASNLHRQVLFGSGDVGSFKVDVARQRLTSIFPDVEVVAIRDFVSSENISALLDDVDIVVDGTDNLHAKYLINDYCFIHGKVMIYGAVFGYEGQVAVFNGRSQRKINYRDLFPEPPDAGAVPDCSSYGVMPGVVGITGCYQALETIKVICDIKPYLEGKLLIIDGLNYRTRVLEIQACERNPLRNGGYLRYPEVGVCSMPYITADELQKWKNENVDFQVLDVRERDEFARGSITMWCYPLSEIMKEPGGAPIKSKRVVVCCRSGIRSQKAISILRKVFPDVEFYNLKGGLMSYISSFSHNNKENIFLK